MYHTSKKKENNKFDCMTHAIYLVTLAAKSIPDNMMEMSNIFAHVVRTKKF